MDRAICNTVGAVLTAFTLSGCFLGTAEVDRDSATPRPPTEVGFVVVAPPSLPAEQAPAGPEPSAPALPSPPPPPTTSPAPMSVVTPTPAAPPRQTSAVTPQTLSNIVRFSEDAYLPDPGSEALLRAHAAQLKADPSKHLLLKGHGDARGGVRYNQALATKRAEMVAKALRGYGAGARQLTLIAIGDDDDPNAPEVRRVLLIYR